MHSPTLNDRAIRVRSTFSFLVMAAFVFSATSALADPESRTQAESYDEYQDCLATIGKKAKRFGYAGSISLSMRKVHERVSADLARCNELLPEDEREDADYRIRGITLLTTPEEVAGSEKDRQFMHRLSAGMGLALSQHTGKSLVLDGEVVLKFPDVSIYSLTEAYSLKLAGLVHADSGNVNKARVLVRGAKQLSLELGAETRSNWKKVFNRTATETVSDDRNSDHDEGEKDDALSLVERPVLANIDDFSMSHVATIGFERDLAMGLRGEGYASYGLRAEGEGGDRGGAGEVTGDFGVSSTPTATVPFVRLKVQGEAFYCPWVSKSKQHLFCVSADVAVKYGIPQAALGAGAGAGYRYKALRKKRKWMNQVDIGVDFRGDASLNIDGAHSAAGAMFGVKVR